MKNTLSIVDFEKLNEQRGKLYLYWSFTLTRDNVEAILLTDMQHPFRYEGIAYCICEQGSGHISIDMQSFILKPGSMLVALPSTIINIEHLSDDFQGKVVAAGRQLLDEIEMLNVLPYYHQIKRHPQVQLSQQQQACIFELVDLMDRKGQENDNPYWKKMIHHLMSAVLLEVCNQYRLSESEKSDVQTRKELIFKDFLTSLGTNCQLKHNVSFYADEQYLTSKYFSSVVKEVSGISANEWIAKALILNAKVLLKSNEMTIQQISDALQFPNPSFFGQYFKKHTGLTPRQFRMH